MCSFQKAACALVLLASFPCAGLAQPQTAAAWRPLFDGADISGWTQRGGKAAYTVEDSALVGRATPGTPNSFLSPPGDYGDFILEYDAMVDSRLNSGVQIRSQSLPSYQQGRVHGYQIELDPSPRAYTGGIYDEARRGWLYPLSRNPEGREVFRQDQWNHFRVEAIGHTIRTWVNGQMTANLVDDLTPRGFIGFQVHSIGAPALAGAEVKWRNIRILETNLEAARMAVDPDVPEFNYVANTLTEAEQRKGWRLLWDGRTTDGWRSAKGPDFPANGWSMADGVLTIAATDGKESAGAGDLITRDVFSNFELEVDFMIAEGANSGIKYFVLPELNKGQGSAIGLEFQILDDERHPDAKAGVGGSRTIGSLYDLIPAENLTSGGRKPVNPPGSWNRARILVQGDHVEHWLNNMKVVEYERGSQMYRSLVQRSKYAKWPNFGMAEAGHLLLQEHGNEAHFRSIKVREF